MRRFGVAVAMGLMVVSSTSALAGAPPPAPAEAKPEKKKFNFDGDTISTDFLKPGTMLLEGVTRGRRSSLIEVRLDFVPELMRSADDI
ncbi:MAG: hypothetical protein IT385_04805 [Deltaproteobacteria bacterium]|nr:hypothetical protein [Deltaproteobacteria bacterium]